MYQSDANPTNSLAHLGGAVGIAACMGQQHAHIHRVQEQPLPICRLVEEELPRGKRAPSRRTACTGSQGLDRRLQDGAQRSLMRFVVVAVRQHLALTKALNGQQLAQQQLATETNWIYHRVHRASTVSGSRSCLQQLHCLHLM